MDSLCAYADTNVLARLGIRTLQLLGHGVTGVCFSTESGVIKHIQFYKYKSQFAKQYAYRQTHYELRIMKFARCDASLLSSRRIIQPQSESALQHGVYVLLPSYPSSLKDVSRNPCLRAALNVPATIAWVLRGLAILHAAHIAHMDVKPANILIDSARAGAPGYACLADFGMAVPMTSVMARNSTWFTTWWFRAPEICSRIQSNMHAPLSGAADVWAVGCILFALTDKRHRHEHHEMFGVRRSHPSREVNNDTLQRLHSNFFRNKTSIIQQACGDDWALSDLLCRMLIACPTKRITAASALAHPYLSAVTLPPMPDVPMFSTPIDNELLYYHRRQPEDRNERTRLWSFMQQESCECVPHMHSQ